MGDWGWPWWLLWAIEVIHLKAFELYHRVFGGSKHKDQSQLAIYPYIHP